MRKAIILRMWGALAGMFLLVSPLSAALSEPALPQPFVRVNGFYFLYTYPVVPYLDKSGALMVGLEGMGRGLFAKAPPGDRWATYFGGDDYGRVTTDSNARTETLALGGHTLTFTAGSNMAQVDRIDIPLDAAAVMDARTGQMVVPAQGLARCLGLPAHWDPQRHTLSLTGPDVLTLRESNFTAQYLSGLNTTGVVPDRVTFHSNDAPLNSYYVTRNPDRHKVPWLMIEMKNVADVVLIGGCDLHIRILYSSGAASPEVGEGSSINSPDLSQITGDGERRNYPLALQTDLDGDFPLCVVSYPASASS